MKEKRQREREILKMKQNKKIFLPWYKKKNRGRDKWNRFCFIWFIHSDKWNRKKKMHTYKEQKQNTHTVVTRENRKGDIKPTRQMSEIDPYSVYIIGK